METADKGAAEYINESNRPPQSPIMRYFAFEHLPDGEFKLASIKCFELAAHMEAALPPGPEKSAGLRHLLEAKDCFVRAALPQD
jgi:hypothetical protein